MRASRMAALACLLIGAGAATAEEIDNPEFASWSKFKKGTSITMKTSSTAGKVASEVTITTVLVEVGADKVVVETSTVSKFNGMEFKAPAAKREIAKTVTLPKGVAKGALKGGKPAGTVEEGSETVKVGGTAIKTKWYKYTTEIGGTKSEGKMWSSDEVPGGLVKMESTTSGAVDAKVKMELVEIKKP